MVHLEEDSRRKKVIHSLTQTSSHSRLRNTVFESKMLSPRREPNSLSVVVISKVVADVKERTAYSGFFGFFKEGINFRVYLGIVVASYYHEQIGLLPRLPYYPRSGT